VDVRRARSDEIGPCADLYLRVLTETFTWMPPERHRRDDFLRAAREEEVYVAVEAGRVVGLAAFYRPQNFIHSLYVDARGRGVGRILLHHVLQVAEPGPVSLKVQAPNLRAQAFYEREGFVALDHGQDLGSDVTWIRYAKS
jgi:ribosomal protein S18 acetylase RimI-like enzyme